MLGTPRTRAGAGVRSPCAQPIRRLHGELNCHFTTYHSQYHAHANRNLFAIDYLKDRTATHEEFMVAWDKLDDATRQVSWYFLGYFSQRSHYSCPSQTYKQHEIDAKTAAKARG